MSFCTLTLDRIFMLAQCSTPSQTSLKRSLWFIDHRIILEIELFTALNSGVGGGGGAVKQKLTGVPFLFELVAMVSSYAI